MEKKYEVNLKRLSGQMFTITAGNVSLHEIFEKHNKKIAEFQMHHSN